jgi:hypothetical protein
LGIANSAFASFSNRWKSERVLGRGVYTHEFAHPYALIAELLGEAKRPSFDEILAKLPASAKTILVKAP